MDRAASACGSERKPERDTRDLGGALEPVSSAMQDDPRADSGETIWRAWV